MVARRIKMIPIGSEKRTAHHKDTKDTEKNVKQLCALCAFVVNGSLLN